MPFEDVRYTLRRFAKHPGFLIIAVVVLALGIGANTCIFSFVNAYLLSPLPSVRDVDRVITIDGRRRGFMMGVSYPDYLDFEQQNHAFESMAAVTYVNPILTGRGEPERVQGLRVSPKFFDLFTTKPALGRAFLPAENAAGGETVVMISEGFWQRHLGGRAEALNETLVLDGVSHKIVGILPHGFRFGWQDVELFAPLTVDLAKSPRGRRQFDVYGRLKPDVRVAGAQGEIDTIARRLEMQYPDTNQDVRASVQELTQQLGQGPREAIRIVMGVVVFVLLIACANVANLQLARATGRSNEIAIRTALGARRWRIVRQVLTESLIVSVLGGILGYGVGVAGVKILLAAIPPNAVPINEDFLDFGVLGFTALVALATGVVAGLAPAFQISSVNVNDVLKEGGRKASGGAARGRLRTVFVVAEMSLAVVLLLGAGLLIKGFRSLMDVNPGFRVDGMLTARIVLPDTKYSRPEQRTAFYRDLVDRMKAIPGVQSAAAGTGMPLLGGAGSNFVIEGQPVPAAGHENAGRSQTITTHYFQTLGIPLRRGRYFSEQDTAESLPVVVINERLAQQFFGGQDPVGKRLKWSRDPQSSAPWKTIVGVIADTRSGGLGRPTPLEMFAPLPQEPRSWMVLAMRTHADDPTGSASALRAELRALDRDQPITQVRSMRSVMDDSTAINRLMAVVVGVFAGIAMMMASIGIYAVVAYSVGQRTQEFGIRMALGAGSRTVVRLVLKQALWMVGIAFVIGLPVAAVVSRLLGSFLNGVEPRDPVIFTLVPAILAVVAMIASYVPARRATRVDPVTALRYE